VHCAKKPSETVPTVRILRYLQIIFQLSTAKYEVSYL
jgi:hypothetical protein